MVSTRQLVFSRVCVHVNERLFELVDSSLFELFEKKVVNYMRVRKNGVLFLRFRVHTRTRTRTRTHTRSF